MTGYPNAQNNPAGAIPVYTAAQPQGGASPFLVTTQLAALTTIKSSAGTLYAIDVYNPSTAIAYLQVFDASAVTVGTTLSSLSLPVLTNTAREFTFGDAGVAFSNAIQIAATTLPKGNVAPNASLVVNAVYE